MNNEENSFNRKKNYLLKVSNRNRSRTEDIVGEEASKHNNKEVQRTITTEAVRE